MAVDTVPGDVAYLRNLTAHNNNSYFNLRDEWKPRQCFPDVYSNTVNARQIANQGGRIVIYGTGDGGLRHASDFEKYQIPVFGFVSQGAEQYPDGILGKPVFPPEWLQENRDVYVVVASSEVWRSRHQILECLEKIGFPGSHIIDHSTMRSSYDEIMHFEFLEYYKRNTALLDCGSLDGGTSVLFSKFTNGNYSKIFSFEAEPDKISFCQEQFQNARLHDAVVLPYAVMDYDGVVQFNGGKGASSHITTGESDTSDTVLNVECRKDGY